PPLLPCTAPRPPPRCLDETSVGRASTSVATPRSGVIAPKCDSGKYGSLRPSPGISDCRTSFQNAAAVALGRGLRAVAYFVDVSASATWCAGLDALASRAGRAVWQAPEARRSVRIAAQRLLRSVYPRETLSSWSSCFATRRGFGDLEAYEHLASRDVWCCDFQVWQILSQPRGGSAIRLLRSSLILEDADRGRSFGDLEQVIGLEPVDAADELPNVFRALGERVCEVAIPGVCADNCVHSRYLISSRRPRSIAVSHDRAPKSLRPPDADSH